VVTDVTTDIVITKEETSARWLRSTASRPDDEAIWMANDTPTLTLPRLRGREDIGRIWRVAEALEYGIVGINEGIISPNPLARSPPSAA
jgi:succinate-semialdehyde dehydrogenase/glutarate-semialdehyde dehydrogenase